MIADQANSDIGHFDTCLQLVSYNDDSDSYSLHTVRSAYVLIKVLHVNRTILLGFCLPETCSRAEIQNLLNDILLYLGLEGNFTIESVINSEPIEWTTYDYSTLGFLTVLVTLVMLGSTGQYSFLRAFSIVQNSNELFSITNSNKEFGFINGLKVFSFIHVACSHILNITMDDPRYNGIGSRFFLFLEGHMSADTFFLLSGLLMSYQFMKKQETG